MIEVVREKKEPEIDFGFCIDTETFFVVHNRKVYEVGPDDEWKERPDLDWRKML